MLFCFVVTQQSQKTKFWLTCLLVQFFKKQIQVFVSDVEGMGIDLGF